LVLATIFVVGASAAGAGAFATSPYVGSDTEYNITNQAILNSQLGNNPTATTTPPQWNARANPVGDYLGGGSGGGENAMVANKQQTAPMSRALASGACAAADVSQASNIVLAIDGVGVWAANAVINSAANGTNCNGATATGQCTQDSSGVAFSGAGGNTMGFTNWRDALALLYGGLDRSNGVTDCNSTKRQTLISNWTNLFQNSGCVNGVNNTMTPTGAFLTHAWRRDDISGTADAFSNLIGIQANWKDPNNNTFSGEKVAPAGVNGFGTSPYCNALNWDQGEVSAGACANTAPNHYIGPGGVVGADGKHHLPPPGTWGSVGPTAQPFVLSTFMQDNDPIRTTCLGNASAGRNAEDVCNTDGKLGVVLPISALDFMKVQIPGTVPFPAGVQCTGGTSSGAAPKSFLCAPRGKGSFFAVSQCPNGDTPFAFGCLIPVGPGSSGPTSQCLTIKSEFPTLCNVGPCSNEGRIYNAQLYDGTAAGAIAYATQSISESSATLGIYTNVLSHAGGWARIHMREVSTTGAKSCQLDDASDNIGCLVQADQHSVGFAGNTAATWDARDPVAGHSTATGDTVAVRVNKLEAGVSCTPANPSSGNPSYPLWRKLYFNSIVGFGRVTNTAEQTLAEFESFDQNIAPILAAEGFFELPFSPNGTDPTTGGIPNQFCEDFNELGVACAGKTSNAFNGCAFNTTTDAVGGAALVNTTIPAFTSLAPGAITTPGCAGLPAGSPGCTIPSDPSSDPTMSTTSTVCGNGKVELFEDCDPAPPSSSPNCSNTCRSTL
jgi:ABC-type phosphate transport system substrate-binding protein